MWAVVGCIGILGALLSIGVGFLLHSLFPELSIGWVFLIALFFPTMAIWVIGGIALLIGRILG